MVRDLLTDYVPGPWLEQADFTSLERVNASYVSESERQQGLSQGLIQGRQQGLIKFLALQLQLRFGPVPDWAQGRLDAADEAQLLVWVGKILSAHSLTDLFGDDRAEH